jgi:hypothetical protein
VRKSVIILIEADYFGKRTVGGILKIPEPPLIMLPTLMVRKGGIAMT